MKNNKKIISEINRVHELMGIKSNVLNEQAGIIDDILKKVVPDMFKVADSPIAKAYSKMSDTSLSIEGRKEAMEDFIKLSKTEMPELYSQIRKITLDDSDIQKVINRLFTSEQKQTFTKNVETLLKRGDTDEEVMVQYKNNINRTDLSHSQRAALEQRMRNEISTIRTRLVDSGEIAPLADDAVETGARTRITNDPPTPKTGDDAVETGARESGDDAAETGARESSDDAVETGARESSDNLPNPEDVQKEIDSWAKWDEIPDYTSKEIDELLYYNRLSKWLKDVFTMGETKLLNRVKRFNKLSKAYATSVERGVSTQTQARLESEMIKELEGIMETSLKNRKESEIWIINTIEGFEKTKKGVIIDPSERRFAEWAKKVMNEDGTLKNPSEIRKLNIRESSSSDLVIGLKEAFAHWKRYPEFWNQIFRKKAPDTASKSNFLPWFVKGSRRGNPWRGWNKKNWDDVINEKGLGSAKRQYIYELLFRYFQWNIIWGLGETVYQSIVSATADSDTREKIENCIKARALEDTDNTKENQVKQYCESIKTMEEIQLLHYLEDSMSVVLFKNMVYDWGDKDGGLIDTFTDLFPGKLDDMIIDKVIPYFKGTRNAKTVEEWQDMWGDAVDNVKVEAEKAENALKDGAEENGIVLPTGDEDSTPESSGGQTDSSETPNTLAGLATQMGYPKDQMSPQVYNGTGVITIWGMKFEYNSTDKEFKQKQKQ